MTPSPYPRTFQTALDDTVPISREGVVEIQDSIPEALAGHITLQEKGCPVVKPVYDGAGLDPA